MHYFPKIVMQTMYEPVIYCKEAPQFVFNQRKHNKQYSLVSNINTTPQSLLKQRDAVVLPSNYSF